MMTTNMSVNMIRTTPQRCECGTRHRTWHTFARCQFPDAVRVMGRNGPFASVSRCRRYGGPDVTVVLHTTREDASQARAFIDRLACGGRGERPSGHTVIDLREV
jgi:hypothetical protein